MDKYIGYIIAPPRKRGVLHDPNVENSIELQKQILATFLQENLNVSEVSLMHILVEQGEKKRNRCSWPILEESLNLCKEKNAKLVIVELRNLTNNDSFTSLLKKYGIEFHCCDQPLVNQATLNVVAGYQKNLRKIHGDLIKRGLARTQARSGNPRAKDVIGKVNKPKIEKAIIFALIMQPIVADFKAKGFSQRRMVKELNDMNFNAPEGGKWVLSQLQKVLDRIRLNEIAMELQPKLLNFKQNELTLDEIVDALNKAEVTPLKKDEWTEKQAQKVMDRVKEIYDIILFNEFVKEASPAFIQFKSNGLSDANIIENLIACNAKIPAVTLEEMAE